MDNICNICSRTFKSIRSLSVHIKQHRITPEQYVIKTTSYNNKCKYCKSETKFKSLSNGFSLYCSYQCSSLDPDKKNKTRETNLKRYGVENPSQNNEIRNRIKKTNIKKYGVENPSQVFEFKEKKKETNLKKYGVENPSQVFEFKEKKKETNLKRYGVENPSQNPEIRNKTRETNLKKYGVENPSQVFEFKEIIKNTCLEKYGVEYFINSIEFKDKTKETNLKRYGVENPSQNPEIKNKVKNISLKKFLIQMDTYLKEFNLELLDKEYRHAHFKHRWKCLKCNHVFKTLWNHIQQLYKCPSCYPRNSGSSELEKEILEFVKSITNCEILENSRNIIPPKEIDIYIPSKNIAIEFNGLYWHSDEWISDSNYHLNKTELCEKHGIQLIHIFEDEWVLKQDIVKSKLRNILNIKSDNIVESEECDIKEIDSKTKNEFLNDNHIQGETESIVNLGSFYRGELISLMTFSKDSDNQKWELNRCCSKLNYQIPGIALKLLSHFKNNYIWNEIFVYVGRRWSQGDVFKDLKFELSQITDPNYCYIKGIHRFNSNVNEGFYKIWDCGNLKFKMLKTLT